MNKRLKTFFDLISKLKICCESFDFGQVTFSYLHLHSLIANIVYNQTTEDFTHLSTRPLSDLLSWSELMHYNNLWEFTTDDWLSFETFIKE